MGTPKISTARCQAHQSAGAAAERPVKRSHGDRGSELTGYPAAKAAALKSTKPGLRWVTNDRKRFELATESIPKISHTKVGLRVFHRCSFCCQEHDFYDPAAKAAALKSTKPGLRRVTDVRQRFELATESIPKISHTKVGLRACHRCKFSCQEP